MDAETKNRIARAEAEFEIAQELVGGGYAAALLYAEEAAENYQKINPGRAFAGGKDAWVRVVAKNALGCARSIIADGRSHYVAELDGRNQLIVCTLGADASAGAIGYDLWGAV